MFRPYRTHQCRSKNWDLEKKMADWSQLIASLTLDNTTKVKHMCTSHHHTIFNVLEANVNFYLDFSKCQLPTCDFCKLARKSFNHTTFTFRALGTITMLRQQKDWVGGFRKWQFLLMFSTVFLMHTWVWKLEIFHIKMRYGTNSQNSEYMKKSFVLVHSHRD